MPKFKITVTHEDDDPKDKISRTYPTLAEAVAWVAGGAFWHPELARVTVKEDKLPEVELQPIDGLDWEDTLKRADACQRFGDQILAQRVP